VEIHADGSRVSENAPIGPIGVGVGASPGSASHKMSAQPGPPKTCEGERCDITESLFSVEMQCGKRYQALCSNCASILARRHSKDECCRDYNIMPLGHYNCIRARRLVMYGPEPVDEGSDEESELPEWDKDFQPYDAFRMTWRELIQDIFPSGSKSASWMNREIRKRIHEQCIVPQGSLASLTDGARIRLIKFSRRIREMVVDYITKTRKLKAASLITLVEALNDTWIIESLFCLSRDHWDGLVMTSIIERLQKDETVPALIWRGSIGPCPPASFDFDNSWGINKT
jgi:hypothetical protein